MGAVGNFLFHASTLHLLIHISKGFQSFNMKHNLFENKEIMLDIRFFWGPLQKDFYMFNVCCGISYSLSRDYRLHPLPFLDSIDNRPARNLKLTAREYIAALCSWIPARTIIDKPFYRASGISCMLSFAFKYLCMAPIAKQIASTQTNNHDMSPPGPINYA